MKYYISVLATLLPRDPFSMPFELKAGVRFERVPRLTVAKFAPM